MNIALTPVIISLFLVYLTAVFGQICQRLNTNLFQRCIQVAGYNFTAKFPGNSTLRESIIAHNLKREVQQFGHCSQYLDTIMCAINVPKCVEENYSPVLPCRRVCEYFVRDCETKVEYEKLEWIKGLCHLLPSSENNSKGKECYLPGNYRPRLDNTTPLTQSCSNLTMSSCSHLGYTRTTQSLTSQRILDIVLKKRLSNFGNHSFCSPLLQKIFCAEFAPPCFQGDETEIILRTVCKSDCESMRQKCPALYREHFGEYSYCEQMATESSDLEGFCTLTKWPTAGRWPLEPNTTMLPRRHSSTIPRPSSTLTTLGSAVVKSVPLHVRTRYSLPVVAIIVSTVVVVLSIIVVTAFLLLLKRGRYPQDWWVLGYKRHPSNEWETTVALKT
ncbi:frizzled-4-like [Stylophora pistillata]|uniref:FZ domain-containing protein n=1 Tax=Stylophora pistillata TaxID=50429 RepID=A0A2B4SZC6_STYPI|nr:frizzled-4-like [Stylophora pistillata]PFX33908.1 hypothetical protein AWC38_SpisGene1177 [Stylophora pistillata]